MCWQSMTDDVLLRIFDYLPASDLCLKAAPVCSHWYDIAQDESLWKSKFHRRYAKKHRCFCSKGPHFTSSKKQLNEIGLSPGCLSWKDEFRRLFFLSPWSGINMEEKVPEAQGSLKWFTNYAGKQAQYDPRCPETICNAHYGKIKHVSFSADGERFATCGQDATICVWSAAGYPCKLLYSSDMSKFCWQSAQFCEFNKKCTKLLVSGILLGNVGGRINGEIIVFNITEDKFRICARISNKPYDSVGCWYGNKYVLSSEFKWLAHMISSSRLWTNRVDLSEGDQNDYTLSCMRPLFNLYNRAGNAARHMIVAECSKPLVADHREQSSSTNKTKGRERRLSLLENLDEIATIKQIIAKDHPVILEGELRPQQELPSIPEDKACHEKILDVEEATENEIVATDDVQIDLEMVKQTIAFEDPIICNLILSQDQSIPNVDEDVDSNRIKLLPHWRLEIRKTPEGRSAQNASCHVTEEENGDDSSLAPSFTYNSKYYQTRQLASELGVGDDNDWIYEDDDDWDEFDEENTWEYWNENDEASVPDFLKIDEGFEVINEGDRLLIFTTGDKTHIPHKVGIKRMTNVRFRKHMNFDQTLKERVEERDRKKKEQENIRQMERESNRAEGLPNPEDIVPSINWYDYSSVSHKFDCVDFAIEMHGRIVGLALSPDNRFLYISTRPWPKGYCIKNEFVPPPISMRIHRHVFDLCTMEFCGKQTECQCEENWTFLPGGEVDQPQNLSVTKHYVGGVDGINDCVARLWDRHYGTVINEATFEHDEPITCIAINPRNEQMVVTVSEDGTIKVWRSRSLCRKIDEPIIK